MSEAKPSSPPMGAWSANADVKKQPKELVIEKPAPTKKGS